MASKLKTPAALYAPQTQDDCAADIKKLGDLQREQARECTVMNDSIAAVTAQHQPTLDGYKARIETLQRGVQTYCEANRDALTSGGRTKTANLITGEVQWRQRPPSVSARGLDSILDTLKRLALTRFIRVKEELNKDALLNEPDAARGIAGLSIVTGVEDFVITPFEAKTPGQA